MARNASNVKGPNSGMEIPKLSEAQQSNFNAKVSRGKTETCWLWTGSKDDAGYGRLCINYRYFRAHRVAYALTFGSVPAGMVIAHKCNTPSCCNPHHLELSSQRENVKYSVRLGRTKLTPRMGEQCKQAALTAEQVIEIRSTYDQGGISQKALAEAFGITQASISAITRRKNWKHLP